MLTSQRRFIRHQTMRSDFWGSREGIVLICFRISNIIGFSCGRTEIFSKMLLVCVMILHEVLSCVLYMK